MSANQSAVPATPPPDAGSVRGDDWPRRAFPPAGGERPPGFAAVLDRSALHAVYLHGRESPDVEVCGVLVGMVGADDAGPFVHVRDVIRGEHAANQAGQVTFTAATWDHIQREMDRRDPAERIVGWYHTHPDFGIFLSGMDLFIHQHFFDLPWQLAFVYDPIRRQEGLFVWRSGKPVEEAFLVHENTPSSDLPQVVLKGPPRPLAPEPLDRSAELGQRLTGLEHRISWLSAGLVVALVVTLLWPLALFLAALARAPKPPPDPQPPAPATVHPVPVAPDRPDEHPAPPEKAAPDRMPRADDPEPEPPAGAKAPMMQPAAPGRGNAVGPSKSDPGGAP